MLYEGSHAPTSYIGKERNKIGGENQDFGWAIETRTTPRPVCGCKYFIDWRRTVKKPVDLDRRLEKAIAGGSTLI